MGCLSTKEEVDDDSRLVVDNGRHTCCSNCFSNGIECRSCSVVVLTCAVQTCSDCGEIHCSNCLHGDSSRHGNDLVCTKCLFLSSGQFMPRDLMAYSIRELRQFLFRKEIAADHCKEKSDLIDLVMLLSCSSEYLSNINEHSQHVQLLRERMLMEQFSEPSNLSSELQNESNSTGYGHLPLPINVAQSLSIDSAFSSTEEKLSSSEANALEREKEDEKGAVSDNSKGSSVSVNEHDCLTHTQNVSIEVNVDSETELIKTDDCVAPQIVENSSRPQQSATNENSESQEKKTADSLCHVCSKAKTDCVFLECGHMITCYSCGEQLVECPVCLNYITRRVRAFRV